ncbi:MAG: class I SAM-dependent methyltransferase [Parcubacteria group bacterium]|jgi:2-polyprenyl-3-methyl-5-hydroxy-6-metoxy-1,4-benzoquinol methylase
MSLIKTKYDKNYFENYFYREKLNSQRNEKRIKELLKNKKDGELLELGCGEGNFLKKAEPFFNISGLDISSYAVRKAIKLLGYKVYQDDINGTSLRKNYYDAIIAFNVLEHMKNPKIIINKSCQALKKDGILFGSVPNNFGVIGKIATKFSNKIDKTHCSTYIPSVWKKHFSDAGFKSIIFFGETPIGRNRNIYLKNKLWKYFSFNLIFVCKK